MEKKFSKFFIASMKRTAQTVAPLVRKKEKLREEINKKQEELAQIEADIDEYQGPIKRATGGYTTEDLVERVVVDKVDKEGKPIKSTSYNLKYPDTVVPVKASGIIEEEPQENTQSEDLPFMTEDVMNPSDRI